MELTFDTGVPRWRTLVPLPEARRDAARLQLHWAAQVIGAVGEALVPAAADSSHTSMSWLDGLGLLAGQPLPFESRVALRLADLTLVVLGPGDAVVAEQALAGRTLDDAVAWTEETLRGVADGELAARVALPTYEMPPHPVAEGASFVAGLEEVYGGFARWYANAALATEAVSAQVPGAGPVRCWPHHFDIATLVTLDAGAAGTESARSIGVGLSPGDGSYAAPYFYVNPWPPPEAGELPPLRGPGRWHREGWIGVVLTEEDVLQESSAPQQARLVAAYLESALDANRRLLGAE